MTDSVKIYSAKKNQNKPNPEEEKSVEITDEVLSQQQAIDKKVADMPTEYGGRPKDKGLEPTRYGDWEFKGRCIDF